MDGFKLLGHLAGGAGVLLLRLGEHGAEDGFDAGVVIELVEDIGGEGQGVGGGLRWSGAAASSFSVHQVLTAQAPRMRSKRCGWKYGEERAAAKTSPARWP